jgi:hypothetical protein
MHRNPLRFLGALAVGIAGVSLAAVHVVGQVPSAKPTRAAVATASPLRTPWGDPDFQGVWNHSVTTPFERPAALVGKEFLTDDEVVEAERSRRERSDRDRRDGGTNVDLARDYNEFWDQGAKQTRILSRRTSAIIDPPDGILPALTDEAQRRRAANVERFVNRPPESWEDRNPQERCIASSPNGPPMLSLYTNDKLLGYSDNFQIFQTPDYVAMLYEDFHQVRMIALNGRPHLPSTMRQWLGDSRGHWDSKTLVVDTTNFGEQRPWLGGVRGPSIDENLHLVERFTRVDANTIDYQFTVDDPTTWTRPWSATVSVVKTQGQIYESACHEGNYALPNILRGARAQEQVAAQAAKKGSR